MSNLAYMVWFVGTALGTIAILTTGTLAAAGILTRRRRASATPHGRLAHPAHSSERRVADAPGISPVARPSKAERAD